MRQPDSRPGPGHPGASHPDGGSPPVTAAAIGRLAAVGGVGFLVASLASDLVIGPFPGPDTPPAQLVSFYAAHHAQVGTGGLVLAVSGVFFVLFGLAMIATALAAVTTLISAGTYGVLGDVGALHGVDAAALQAWHIMGSD